MANRHPAHSRLRTGRRLIALLALSVGTIILAPLIWDAVLSALLVVEVLRPLRPGPITWVTRSPLEMRVNFPGRHRMMEANLYLPPGAGRRAGVVLVHGVVETGKDDPRMIWVARLLARSGFVALVPDFSGFKSLRLRTSDIGEMTDAVVYLHSLHEWVRSDRIGMIGYSYGAGPMLIAAADPRAEWRLKFVLSFGGYHDLVRVIKFVTTGYYEYRDVRGYGTHTDYYTRWILKYTLADLTPEGRSVYNLLANRDPEKVEGLVSRLAPSLREVIDQLSPSRQIQHLGAYAIIVHSDPDPYIPYTESLALAEALGRRGKVRLEILRLFRHVQPELPRVTVTNIFRVYFPEGLRIYRLFFDVLRQRR